MALLADLERKLLRILFNYFRLKRHMPTFAELEVKTGRPLKDIRAALLSLEKDHSIIWADKSTIRDIVIIEGWDRDQKVIMPMGDGERYFREY